MATPIHYSEYLNRNSRAAMGYDPNRDTWFGIPSADFHRMNSQEQRYYANKWDRDREWLLAKPQHMHFTDKMLAAVPAFEPSWKSDTKLLLTEN